MKILTKDDITFVKGDIWGWQSNDNPDLIWKGKGPTRFLYGKPKKLTGDAKKRTDWGTAIHAQLEDDKNDVLGQFFEGSDDASSVMHSEVFVYGKICGLNSVGFIDKLLVHADGTCEIIDLKTTGMPVDLCIQRYSGSHIYQIALYASLVNFYGLKPASGSLIYLQQKDGQLTGQQDIVSFSKPQIAQAYRQAIHIAQNNVDEGNI